MATLSPVRKRIAMLIIAVGGALIVERVVALASDEGEVAAPVLAKQARSGVSAGAGGSNEAAAPAAGASRVQMDRLQARQQLGSDAADASQPDLFGTVSWQPPAPKIAAAPPPKPVAPPFPYAYMGGLSEGDARTAFFTKGERVLPVKAGDTIDALYRVDLMTETQMTLTYLPLNETLVVALGDGR